MIQDTVALLRQLLSHRISISEFFDEYADLRTRALNEFEELPNQDETALYSSKVLSRDITEQEFFDWYYKRMRQSRFGGPEELLEYIKAFDLITHTLLLIIDRLEADERTYGNDVLTEAEFYDEIQEVLNRLQQ